MSFCDIQFGKNNKGEHTAVNNEGKESRLYPRLVLDFSEIQNRKAAYTANKEYVDNLVSQNKIAGRSAVDIAKALYGAAYLSGLPEAEFMTESGFQKLVYNKDVAVAPSGTQPVSNQVYQALGFDKMITPNDRVVFGHPTIGKSFLKTRGEDKFISLDDDYATEINKAVKEIAAKYNVTPYQVKDGGTQKWNKEYNQMMQSMFDKAKDRALSEGKTLFTSNTNLLSNNLDLFDKVINLTDKEFNKRIQERGAKYNVAEWKSQINEAVSKVPRSKVITTDKYLADLFLTPEQEQQAQEYSEQGAAVRPGVQEAVVPFDKDTKYQLASEEGRIASEKTIRDLVATASDRIGMRYKIISDRSQMFKGKIEDNVAVINLAYATLDTPIHEILGHPIIRTIRNKSEAQLYQNLLKELEYGIGKQVLDRIKRDYKYKKISLIGTKDEVSLFDERVDSDLDLYEKYNSKEIPYTLEEQQEEAIVELLGMMTADRLDAVKDGKLISLLKRLLKEMKQFVRSLLRQREVEIDKLPDNMTIGDIADLLAYSNSKLILPGNEVKYITPDNKWFRTYAEASNYISKLVKNIEDFDLSNIGKNEVLNIRNEEIEKERLQKEFDNFEFEIKPFDKSISVWIESDKKLEYSSERESFVLTDTFDEIDEISEEYAKSIYYSSNPEDIATKKSIKKHAELYNKIRKLEKSSLNSFIEKNKQFEQSKEIIEEWKRVNNIVYNPEEIYSRGQEFVSVVGAYSNFDVNLIMQNLLQHIEDNQKAGGEFTISAFTKPVDRKIGHLEGGGGKIKFKIYPKPKDILWAANADVFSGSVWDASEKLNSDKQSEVLGVSYTKYPMLENIESVQPNLASIVDNLADHHNELGISLTGNNFRLEYDEDIPYTTKKIIDGVNSILDQKYGKLVKPDLSKKVLKGKKVYEVRWKNGNLLARVTDYNKAQEYLKETFTDSEGNKIPAIQAIDIIEEEPVEQIGIQPTQTEYNLKESIESVKSKAGFLYTEKGDIDVNNVLLMQAEDDLKSLKNAIILYNDNSVNEYYVDENKWFIEFEDNYPSEGFNSKAEAEMYLKIEIEKAKNLLRELKRKPKEYTEQALVNIKIAKLKEVAKKYPRILIRSEVESYSRGVFDYGETLFQKAPAEKKQPLPPTTEAFVQQTKLDNNASNALLAKRMEPLLKQNPVELVQVDTAGMIAYNPETGKVEVPVVEQEQNDQAAKDILNQTLVGLFDKMGSKSLEAQSNTVQYSYLNGKLDRLRKQYGDKVEMKDHFKDLFSFIRGYMTDPEMTRWVNQRLDDKKTFVDNIAELVAAGVLDKRILKQNMSEYLSLADSRVIYTPPISSTTLNEITVGMAEFGRQSSSDEGVVTKVNKKQEAVEDYILSLENRYGNDINQFVKLVENKDGTLSVFVDKKSLEQYQEDKKNKDRQRNIDLANYQYTQIEKGKGRMIDSVPEFSKYTKEEKDYFEYLIQSGRIEGFSCGL